MCTFDWWHFRPPNSDISVRSKFCTPHNSRNWPPNRKIFWPIDVTQNSGPRHIRMSMCESDLYVSPAFCIYQQTLILNEIYIYISGKIRVNFMDFGNAKLWTSTTFDCDEQCAFSAYVWNRVKVYYRFGRMGWPNFEFGTSYPSLKVQNWTFSICKMQ